MNRRSSMVRGSKPLRRGVKVPPYVVPTRRGSATMTPFMVPTRWVKSIFAIFLLPVCAILTQTFFTVFARATITQRLWAGQEFWFFSLGAVLWLIAFIGLPRPILLCVMLVLAAPHITFVSFGADLAKNLGNFSQWVGGLIDKFVQGAHH